MTFRPSGSQLSVLTPCPLCWLFSACCCCAQVGGRDRVGVAGAAGSRHSHFSALSRWAASLTGLATDFCPQNVNISGGTFTLSHGWAPGSLLIYSCPPGSYPVPAWRRCLSNGQWQTPRTGPLSTLRASRFLRAVCKPVRCPAPASFENGIYNPRLGSHPVGGNLSFQCDHGFTLRGSPVRYCRLNGLWDGETAVCDNGAGHCPDPGTSVGTVRTGSQFDLGDKVSYRCSSSNLVLTGSAERECQSNGMWSGTEPICRRECPPCSPGTPHPGLVLADPHVTLPTEPYSYDFPEDVASALGISFTSLLGATNPTQKRTENLGRRIQIQRSGRLNLYLLLDASQSVSQKDFEIFKESATLMVDRIFSFEIKVSVAIITFASEPKTILSVLSEKSRDGMEVISSLEKVCYKDHENASGTNIHKALHSVYLMMNNMIARFNMGAAAWHEIRHAIILLTDDIYAIGVGSLDVDWKELNELGSKKDGERHAFILQNAQAVQQVFEHMLDVSKLTDTICGVGNMSVNASDQERTPWHVTFKPKSKETCRGSLISDQWVLTAAHCFHDTQMEDRHLWRVIVGQSAFLALWRPTWLFGDPKVAAAESMRTSCIQAVSQNKNLFPGLTDVSEVVTDQFLCSGLEEEEDHPCKGVSTTPVLAARPQTSCSLEGVDIKGGSFQLLQGGLALEYLCPSGFYPYPVQTRTCRSTGSWSALQTRDQKIVKKAECRAIRCPRPQDFENGEYWPRSPYYNLSDQISFQCYDGYTLRGSANRTCQVNGRWDGQTAICDDGAGYCPNPGIPIGTRKVGSQYRLEDTVTYHCSRGLVLRGSQQRACQEGGSWSGTEPSCQGEQQKRKIILDPSGSMNIYLVLDGSDSIGASNFTGAKRCLANLIEKVASYGVRPKYGLVTYATVPKVLVRVSDEKSSDADWVTEKLNQISYEDHKLKSGTNTKKALQAVYSMMSWAEDVPPEGWNRTRHVIIIMTDGLYNMGGDPVTVIEEIRNLLDIGRDRKNPREDYLDVYVFGVGPLVDSANINALASKKDNEQHVFKVKDMESLEDVFYQMIGRKMQTQRPLKGHENCMGAVVSEYFVLTAAHCFTVEDQKHSIKVNVGGKKQDLEIEEVLFHPNYNINEKKAQGIPEFYDYDVALIKLKTKLKYDQTLRPICLPCTEGTTRALRLPQTATCKQHKEELLPVKDVKALFVSEEGRKLTRKEVYIKNGDKKASCERDALRAQGYDKVKDVSEVVTPRFLCTGGVDPYADPNTCKGDSGGPLIVHKRSRFIQVGVISWGVVDVCKGQRRQQMVPAHARDFHVNLFQVLPWLKEKLKDEDLGFL
ncbi:complement factor B [Cricetulus griseus]